MVEQGLRPHHSQSRPDSSEIVDNHRAQCPTVSWKVFGQEKVVTECTCSSWLCSRTPCDHMMYMAHSLGMSIDAAPTDQLPGTNFRDGVSESPTAYAAVAAPLPAGPSNLAGLGNDAASINGSLATTTFATLKRLGKLDTAANRNRFVSQLTPSAAEKISEAAKSLQLALDSALDSGRSSKQLR